MDATDSSGVESKPFQIVKNGTYADQMLRASQAHLVQLSAMADAKANMLLTMSSVVMTLSMPRLLDNTHFWPLLVLVGSCLLTICLATYAVMPKLPPSSGLVPDMNSKHFNPLFFGDFTRISQEQFESTMENIINDHSRVYGAQVRELYLLGTFLAKKKYRFLRLAYISFISGLIASFLGFLIAVLG